MIELYKQGERCWGLFFEMPEMISLRDSFMLCPLNKVHRTRDFLKTFPLFVARMAGREPWSDEELKAEPYFNYLLNAHRRGSEQTCSVALLRKVLKRMRTAVRLYYDILDYGVKAPMDMYRDSGRLILGRGNRCLEIMRQLGYENVICRLFDNHQIYLQNLAPSAEWGPLKGA